MSKARQIVGRKPGVLDVSDGGRRRMTNADLSLAKLRGCKPPEGELVVGDSWKDKGFKYELFAHADTRYLKKTRLVNRAVAWFRW